MSTVREGATLSNFTILSIKPIPEYKATGIFLRHRTGALAYHLLCDDSENLFSFAFRTPSSNDRGAAHIIEHSVLAGSRSFPIKDPFLELMKGSVNTFLNAMTYPDKTVYPASSTVEADYFNLMRVYGDAVFFPLLRREIFHQEGRRFELTPEGKLVLSGVVYNEMLGNYSEHDSIVGEWSYRSLFPDSPYRFDSGGAPESIPDLTYEEFKAFHERYYHPSNCLIFLYGNIATERQLEFVDRHFLAAFEPRPRDFAIPAQPRWSAPRDLTVPSPTSDGEESARKSSITLNWLQGSVLDPKETLSAEILTELLLGNSGAPLHQAIVESRLGDDLSPQSGLDTDIREMVFTVGVRGTDPERRAELERLVLGELAKLAEHGIPKDVLEGALKRVEFRNREIPGGAPFGLRLQGKALRGWLHGAAPETTLEFARWMEEIRREVSAGPYFEAMIKRLLLDNPHRSTVTVIPDADYARKKQEELEARLAKRLAAMSEEEKERTRRDVQAMRRLQDEPDPPALVADIPSIALADLPSEVDMIETEERVVAGAPFYLHDLFTNGVVYVDLAFDLGRLDGERQKYLPLFSRSICGLGFPEVPYDEVARRLALRTGGVFSFLESNGLPARKGGAGSYLFFRLKVLESDLREGIEMLRRMVLDSDFTDFRRIRSLLMEMRNDFKSSIIPRGNSYAALRAGSRLSSVLAREEQWAGTAQLLFLDSLARAQEAEVALAREYAALRSELFVKSGLTVNLTGEGAVLDEASRLVADLVGALGGAHAGAAPKAPIQGGESAPGALEVFAIPSDVGYAATALRASTLGEPSHAHEVLLAHLLRTDYLWEKIRMRGGAYGASAAANGTEGLFSFSSYRDPQIATTLDVFRESLGEYARRPVDPATLRKAIIGSVGRELHPLSPAEKGLVALRRKLYGITDAMRQAKRDAMIAARPEDLSAAAERLLGGYGKAVSAVLAGKALLEAAGERLPGLPEPVTLPV